MTSPPDFSEQAKQLDAMRAQMNASIEKFRSDQQSCESLSIDIQKSWSTSLGIANGSGLLALGSALLNAKGFDIWFCVLPAMWAFAFGVVLAGLIPLVLSAMYSNMAASFGMLHLSSISAAKGILPSNYEKIRQESGKHSKNVSKLNKYAKFLSRASCGLFSIGVFWPLVTLTFRISYP